jgi:hypothetical protein
MRISIVSAFLGLLILGPGGEPLPAQSQQLPAAQVRLPKGTEIIVRMDYGVSSKAARAGDPVYMKVARAVVHAGAIVIPEDAPVKGEVAEANPPGGLGKTGSVVIVAEYVTVDEKRIRLSGSTADHGKSARASAADGVVSIPLGALGKGKNVNIEAGTLFFAYTEEDY